MVSEHSAVREREPQPVDATAFCPKKFAAGETELVQIMVHLKGQRRAALRLAREADSRSRFAAPSRSLDELKIGDKVAVHLTVHGAKVDNPPDTQTWIGETLTFSFGVTSNGQTRRVAVNATISINGVCIGRIAFKRSVARTFTLADIARYLFPPRLSRFKRVFFSYSSADRPLVLQQADEYRKFGISFFQDILHLDAGERWERRLWKEINRCDLFVLFWSSHARDSDWVIKEVEHAWRRQARNGGQRPMLRPELLEHPPPLPKQDWLREFNFNDPKFHKN